MSTSRFSDVLQVLEDMILNSQSAILADDAERLYDAILSHEKIEEIRKEIFKVSLEDYFKETREEKKVSHPSQLMSKFDETIKRLPQKLREKIYKENLEMVKKERSDLGWDEVHEELKDRITANFKFNCGECGIRVHKGYFPLCYQCKVTELEIEAVGLAWDEVHEELKDRFAANFKFNCEECGIGVHKGYYPLCYLCKVTELEIEAMNFELLQEDEMPHPELD